MTELKAAVINDIRKMLVYYQALGIDSLPLSVQKLFSTPLGAEVCKNTALAELREEIGDCHRCALSENRKSIVFGTGSPDADIMFIGEAPGKEEDLKGEPFVGEAGMLLTKLIEKMGFTRDSVYIANVVKCRPPSNRDPQEDEIISCGGFLDKQIATISPKCIITLGRIALMTLMNDYGVRITAARGTFFDYRGVPVMPTFHPAYLLRNPKDKWLTWSDVQKVLERLNDRRL